MNVTAATDFITTNKGEAIIIRLADGMTAFGDAFSVNSKGVNIKVDGKTRSIALSKIEGMDLDNLGDDDVEDTDTDEDIYAMLEDGMSTADLAAVISDHLKIALTPKELRVHLRALGLGVGKGRKYSLSATEFRMVRDLINTEAAVTAAATN